MFLLWLHHHDVLTDKTKIIVTSQYFKLLRHPSSLSSGFFPLGVARADHSFPAYAVKPTNCVSSLATSRHPLWSPSFSSAWQLHFQHLCIHYHPHPHLPLLCVQIITIYHLFLYLQDVKLGCSDVVFKPLYHSLRKSFHFKHFPLCDFQICLPSLSHRRADLFLTFLFTFTVLVSQTPPDPLLHTLHLLAFSSPLWHTRHCSEKLSLSTFFSFSPSILSGEKNKSKTVCIDRSSADPVQLLSTAFAFFPL